MRSSCSLAQCTSNILRRAAAVKRSNTLSSTLSSFDSDDCNKNDASSTRRGGIKDTSKEGKKAAKKASKLINGGEDEVIRQGRLGKGAAGMMFDHDDTGRSTASRASQKQKMAKAQAEGLRMLGSKSLSAADNGTSEKELTDSANAHKGFISDADYVESQPGCCGGGKSKSKGKKGAKRREHDVVAFENPLDEEDSMKDIMKELSKELSKE